jgi:hypothetical protein
LLFKLFFLLSQLFEPGVFDRLTSRYTVIRIINQQLLNKIYRFWAYVLNKLRDARALSHIREVELHMSRVFLELLQKLFWWGPSDIVNFNNLVEFIISWE